jgi:hypothetical protein
MVTMQYSGIEFEGAPLAVCVNDCLIDGGQSYEELKKVCFQVQCAFAEMRWGPQGAIRVEAAGSGKGANVAGAVGKREAAR